MKYYCVATRLVTSRIISQKVKTFVRGIKDYWFESDIIFILTLTLLISQYNLQSSGEIMGYFAKDFCIIGSSPIASFKVYSLIGKAKNKNTHNTYPLISKLISIVIDRVTSDC